MMVPFVCPAEAAGLSDEILDNPQQQCMCRDKKGNPIVGPMRKKLLTWTHKTGTEEYGWYVTCGLQCYIEGVTGGSC